MRPLGSKTLQGNNNENSLLWTWAHPNPSCMDCHGSFVFLSPFGTGRNQDSRRLNATQLQVAKPGFEPGSLTPQPALLTVTHTAVRACLHDMDMECLLPFLFFSFRSCMQKLVGTFRNELGVDPTSLRALRVFSPRGLMLSSCRTSQRLCSRQGEGKILWQTRSTDFLFCFRLYCEFQMAL